MEVLEEGLTISFQQCDRVDIHQHISGAEVEDCRFKGLDDFVEDSTGRCYAVVDIASLHFGETGYKLVDKVTVGREYNLRNVPGKAEVHVSNVVALEVTATKLI